MLICFNINFYDWVVLIGGICVKIVNMFAFTVTVCVLAVLMCTLVYFDFQWYEALAFIVGFSVLIYVLFMVNLQDSEASRLLRTHGLGDVFKNIDGFTVTRITLQPNMASTYGEVRCKGVENMYKLARAHDITTFVDIGSGVGKALVLAKLMGFDKCVGVENNENRYRQAVLVKSRLPDRVSQDIELHFLDAMKFDLTSYTTPVLIFISNLLWPNDLCVEFTKKIIEEAPPGSLVVSSKCSYYLKDKERLRNVRMLETPMSWDWQALCYVHEVLTI